MPATAVVCEFWGPAHDALVSAAAADMVGENPAVPLREAINAITALAAQDTDPTEKKDLTTLADTLDSVAMSGGGFAEWDPAFEAFIVKYSAQCGHPLPGG